MPTMPHSAAGWRIEPPVSVPSESGANPAATAAAEPPLEPPGTRARIPRVAGQAEGGVLGRRAHRELVHVGLAERDQPGRLRTGCTTSASYERAVALEDARAGRGRHAARAEQVLERDRHALQPAAAVRVEPRRPRASARPRSDVQEGVDVAVVSRDPVEVGLGQLTAARPRARRAARRSARPSGRACRSSCAPPVGGTRNPSCAGPGAPASTSSRGQDGRGSSAASTFTSRARAPSAARR